MHWELRLIEESAPGLGVLQVNVHADGEGIADVPLRLHSGPWVQQWGYQDAATGAKDPTLPGLVEFVHVSALIPRLLAVGYGQPDEFYLRLALPRSGFYTLDIDLAGYPLIVPLKLDEEGGDG